MFHPISLHHVHGTPFESIRGGQENIRRVTHFFFVVMLNETKENELLWLFLGLFQQTQQAHMFCHYNSTGSRVDIFMLYVNMPDSVVARRNYHFSYVCRWQHNHIMCDRLFFMSSLYIETKMQLKL